MLKLSAQQKEQARVIASLELIRKMNVLCNNPPDHQSDAGIRRRGLCLLQGEISALGGIEAFIAYKKLDDLLKTLSETNDVSLFGDINVKQRFLSLYLELEGFFRSDAVAMQEIKKKKRLFWHKIIKKEEVIKVPILELAFNFCWGADTSRNGSLDIPTSKGQCAVTSMVIQDYYGGDIYKIKVGSESHYFNIIKRQIVDLTANQFSEKIDYKSKELADRNKFEKETVHRYQILKQRMDNYLRIIGFFKKTTK